MKGWLLVGGAVSAAVLLIFFSRYVKSTQSARIVSPEVNKFLADLRRLGAI